MVRGFSEPININMMNVDILGLMRSAIVVSTRDEWEVVWSGELARVGLGLNLVGDRATKPNDDWEPPHRLYNRTGKHSKKTNNAELVEIINPLDEP